MPKLKVRFECGQEDRMSEDYGPYEYVQMTYSSLRISPNGDDFAKYDTDGWWYAPDGNKYSDVVIYPESLEAKPTFWEASDILAGLMIEMNNNGWQALSPEQRRAWNTLDHARHYLYGIEYEPQGEEIDASYVDLEDRAKAETNALLREALIPSAPLSLGVMVTVLTETERWMIINALRTAAETYTKLAEKTRKQNFRSVQFELQAKNVLLMADYLEQADQVEIRTGKR